MSEQKLKWAVSESMAQKCLDILGMYLENNPENYICSVETGDRIQLHIYKKGKENYCPCCNHKLKRNKRTRDILNNYSLSELYAEMLEDNINSFSKRLNKGSVIYGSKV